MNCWKALAEKIRKDIKVSIQVSASEFFISKMCLKKPLLIPL